jgi:hypothetical protein
LPTDVIRIKTKDFEDSTGADSPHDGHPMRAVVVTEYGRFVV